MRNPRMIQRSAVGIAVASIIAALGYVAFAADSARTEKIPASVDSAQYADFMESEAFDLEDLAEGAEIQRRFFNRITPPGFSWIQPMFPPVVPFDATNFDDSFLDALLGEDKNSVAIYPLSLALDPKTRETLVYNAEGKLIAAIPADKNIRSWPEDADPSRVILQLDFLPSEDVEPYLYVESRLAESVSSPGTKSKPARDVEFTMKSLGVGEFGLCNILKLTNGNMRLTVTNGTDVVEVYSYTVLHTASVVVATWTNEQSNVVTDTNTLWTPVSPSFNGIESAWECQTTNLVLTNGVGVWEDSNISSNDRVRFYGVANRMDTDEDGLTDGTEILLHRTDASEIDSDGDYLLDGHDITVDGEDSRYELWAAAGIVHVDDNGLRTFRGEVDAGTDPLDSDTDDDSIPDGEDPDPITPNQEPLVRFRHPLDGQEFSGPAKIALTSDWLYGNETPSHVVYEIVSETDGTTNEVQVAAGENQTSDWYAPPGDFHLLVHGVDAAGQTGETHRVDITVGESDSFAALSSAEKQSVLENGPTAVEGVEEWTYNYSVIRTGNMPVAVSGSRTVAGFANATNFTVILVTNPYYSVEYKDRDLMYAGVTYNTPTTNLDATLYGVTRWGARLEADLPPPPVAPRSWPVAGDTFLVFDQNESGEWVGKVYPGLNNVSSNDPFALLNLGLGWERDAFLYRNGSYQSLTGPGNYNGQDDIRLVFGLNNEGLMVGAGFDYDSYESGSWLEHYQPLAYRSGQTGTVLSVSTQALGGAAYAVNDKGVIVGCKISEGEVPRAVKWVDGNIEPLYGLSGATESVALDISEDGAIAGMKKVNGQWQPFLTDESGSDALPFTAFAGIDFKEFWHVGEYGALGWGISNNAQHLYWVIPDDDQDGFSDIIEQKIVDAVPNDGLTNILDVSSSMDFDGDGLTNLQEWEAQTDPLKNDSDGDRIPDAVDPRPLTYRDTDGDGMPDDWETYYGLNLASGADWNGDLDGDGLTNLEEFQLGGKPNDANSPGYRFHREKLGQLRVEIQDSTNCAGTQGSRQLVERRIQFVEATNDTLPPMEFMFKVSVTGRVERQNSGYDRVSVNNTLAFGGSNEGLECDMGNKSGYAMATLQLPPGDLILSYDTVDGLYHVDGFGEVTDIELVVANTNVVQVNITQVISDQIPGVEINVLPSANAANSPMIMGNRSDNKAYLKVAATIEPSSMASRVRIGVRKLGSTSILDCHTASASGMVPLVFDSGAHELYEIVSGIDVNEDGVLDNREVSFVFPHLVRTITNGAYESDRVYLGTGVIFTWMAHPTAASLLTSFLNQSTPSQFTAGTTTLSAHNDLTHPLGAHWSSSGTATCALYSQSYLTQVLNATDFRSQIIADAGQTHYTEIQGYFNSNTNAQEAWFGPWSFSFPGFEFESDIYAVDSDMLLAFHGVSGMQGIYNLRIRRDMSVAEMLIDSGSFSDTYDFNYTNGGIAQSGATVEAGFDTLGSSGKCFILQVNFNGRIYNP